MPFNKRINIYYPANYFSMHKHFYYCRILKCGKFNRWTRWSCNFAISFNCWRPWSDCICFRKYFNCRLFVYTIQPSKWRADCILWSANWCWHWFLWYSTYPAQIFMGDLGSLTLGAILGTLAVLIRHEIIFAIMAGVFIMETLSVIIQVGSYKLRGKRVFLMAPIHHHFELKGWAEPKVIVRFWIITFVLVYLHLQL